MKHVALLRTLANELHAAEREYTSRLNTLLHLAGADGLYTTSANSPAVAIYKNVEARFVKLYKGKDDSFGAVQLAILRGEAFPAFPFEWLPAGASEEWWHAFDAISPPDELTELERAAWNAVINALLLQSGWQDSK